MTNVADLEADAQYGTTTTGRQRQLRRRHCRIQKNIQTKTYLKVNGLNSFTSGVSRRCHDESMNSWGVVRAPRLEVESDCVGISTSGLNVSPTTILEVASLTLSARPGMFPSYITLMTRLQMHFLSVIDDVESILLLLVLLTVILTHWGIVRRTWLNKCTPSPPPPHPFPRPGPPPQACRHESVWPRFISYIHLCLIGQI